MPDEYHDPVISPTVATLQTEVRWLNKILLEKESRANDRFVAQEKAIAIAENNAEKWRMNANEWRDAMDDREKRFVLKDNLTPIVSAIDKQLEELKTFKDTVTGKGAGLTAAWGYVVTIIGLILSVLGAFGIVLYAK